MAKRFCDIQEICEPLAEAEARLAAAEHKCAVCAFKGDGDRLVSLEARLAAALACHMNCKDCDINQIAGKQEDRIAALEAELATERLESAHWTAAALSEHDENEKLRKLVCYTDDCTVRAVKP